MRNKRKRRKPFRKFPENKKTETKTFSIECKNIEKLSLSMGSPILRCKEQNAFLGRFSNIMNVGNCSGPATAYVQVVRLRLRI